MVKSVYTIGRGEEMGRFDIESPSSRLRHLFASLWKSTLPLQSSERHVWVSTFVQITSYDPHFRLQTKAIENSPTIGRVELRENMFEQAGGMSKSDSEATPWNGLSTKACVENTLMRVLSSCLGENVVVRT